MLIGILPLITKAQTPSKRWKYLYSDTTKNEKSYIDTVTMQKLAYADGHRNLVVIWIRKLSKPNPQGEYAQQDDTKIFVDVSNSQVEVKSALQRYNGNSTQQAVNSFEWLDIPPESNGEEILKFCSNYLKTNQ